MAYVIQSGDTLWNIVRKTFNINDDVAIKTKVDEIAKTNGISNPNNIFAGSTLNLDGVKVDAFEKSAAQSSATTDVQASNTPATKSGQELLSKIKSSGGDASAFIGTLSNSLGMSENQMADYLVELCKTRGGGLIDPTVLFAQICQESGGRADVVGDNGAALGLGQFHTEAVQEVNNQYGTSYTAQDRANPQKALEMMTLLLRYDYNSTGSLQGALAMYNQGHAGALNTAGGQQYVSDVMRHLG